MQISRKAKLIGLSAAAFLVVVSVVLTFVLWPNGEQKKITDPAEFAGDHGVYITGNGAYDIDGNATLKIMQDGNDGWKQFYFTVNPAADLDQVYILPLKAGISVDEIILTDGSVNAAVQSQFAKTVIKADFEGLESLDSAYGFKPDPQGTSERGACLVADDTASQILYFLKDGKVLEGVGVSESNLAEKFEGYGLSLWIKYDWSGEDYDNLFYVGFGEKEQEKPAE
ncbi:MAG: hypothetical protein IKL62_05735 [Clostridia bacterium]|nr:hypothetical protein [Clostridia bacterium]